MKIAVLFPGIGYTCDKPLLYYSGKLAAGYGYEVKPVPYGHFPPGVKGNRRKMEQAFESALEQAEEILKDIEWGSYEEILFISKSVGTIVAAAYAKRHEIRVRSISYTPLTDTFLFAEGEGIMFHGTKDQWVDDSEDIREGCRKIGQRLYFTEGANHSLETGDVRKDIENMKLIMEQTADYMEEAIS